LMDGFIVHGRGGNGAPLDGKLLNEADRKQFDMSATAERFRAGHRIREDCRVPVMIIQSETDQLTLQGLTARQPDSKHVRTWEIAGAAHVDTYGLVAGYLDDGTLPPAVLAKLLTANYSPMGMQLCGPMNSGAQQHYILQAALWHLSRWARGGEAPTSAPPLALDSTSEDVARDDYGIARQGVRSPWVDVPAAVLTGLAAEGDILGLLFGRTLPLALNLLLQRYPGGYDQYCEEFDASTTHAVEAALLLAEDSQEKLGLGKASRPHCPRR
ncbi:MAG: alpha/beta hydrolase domain-containing protein, partial [Parahaliea sp.]